MACFFLCHHYALESLINSYRENSVKERLVACNNNAAVISCVGHDSFSCNVK